MLIGLIMIAVGIVVLVLAVVRGVRAGRMPDVTLAQLAAKRRAHHRSALTALASVGLCAVGTAVLNIGALL